MNGLRLSMRAAYSVMKLFTKRQDKVVFISRQSDAPSADFLLLSEWIKRLSPTTATEFSCRLGLKSEMGLSYIPLLLRQMRMLASARACVVDTYIPAVSMLRHRKGMTVTQIWHSMAAIKKFGWQTVDTPEGSSRSTAEAMRMHRGYDSIITGSEFMSPFFAEAMDAAPKKIRPLGAAHADALISAPSTRRAVTAKYPQIGDRRIILWLPTMRRGEALEWRQLAESFDFERFALIVRLHPLDRETVIDDGRVIVDGSLTSADLICAADAVISDYSGAACDAALRDIPVYFYVPDIERYSVRCGINLDPREVFPELSFTDAAELSSALSQMPDGEVIVRQRRLLAGGCDGHSAERIARLILSGGDTDER